MTLLRFFLFICFSYSVSSAELQLKGELTQGALLFGQLDAEATVRLNGKELAVSPDGKFVFGFGRDAELQHSLTWSLDGETWHSQQLILEPRNYAIQYVEGVPQQTVNPAPAKLKRIREEARLVKKARADISALGYLFDGFIAPMQGPVTGVYGSQRVYNGKPKRPHFGIDYAAPVGTPVYAPAAGVVTMAHADMFYSGGTLIVDHGYGVSSSFLHLSEVLVSEGQNVKQGDKIGLVGRGGRATGPHLDWRMNWLDQRIDPALVLSASQAELPISGKTLADGH